MLSNLRIETFVPEKASQALWEKYFHHEETLFRELNPEDPLPSRKVRRKRLKDPGPYRCYFRWIAVEGGEGEILGSAVLTFETPESPSFSTNKHVAHGEIGIHPGQRRQGMGTQLLKTMVAQAKGEGKAVLEAGTAHDSGERFCRKWGGVVTIEGAENRLNLAGVDWEMIAAWRGEGPERAPGARLESFQEVPEADLEEYTKLYTEVMNQQPLGEMEEEARVTPESRRIQEARLKDQGYTWFTMITREPQGVISGLTETLYNPEEPHKIQQLLTGVREKYRGRGLGKWLKAEMASYIRENYQEVRFIATGNATANAPMLSINRRMGFREHFSGTGFKFRVEDLVRRLGI